MNKEDWQDNYCYVTPKGNNLVRLSSSQCNTNYYTICKKRICKKISTTLDNTYDFFIATGFGKFKLLSNDLLKTGVETSGSIENEDVLEVN